MSREVAAVLVVTALIVGCGDPGISIWIDNQADMDVLVRYEQSAGDRVFAVDTGSSGFLGTFPAPEDANRLVVLAPDCSPLPEPADIPPIGLVTVTIDPSVATVAPTSTPESFDPPAFDEVEICGSYREP